VLSGYTLNPTPPTLDHTTTWRRCGGVFRDADDDEDAVRVQVQVQVQVQVANENALEDVGGPRVPPCLFELLLEGCRTGTEGI
jgi:hypothetical protein